MMPSHAAMPLVDLERLLCRETAHRWHEERRGAPVTEYLLCVRCGKIGDRLFKHLK